MFDKMVEIPDWALHEQDNWKSSIRLQEIFQWAGLVFSLIVVLIAPAINQQIWNYALFMIPLNFFAVARSDYMIHRIGAKMFALEKYFEYPGDAKLQNSGSSKVALFDIPAFVLIAVLGKLFSPYPLSDSSIISVFYWVACAISAIFVWRATVMGKGHKLFYQNTFERFGK